MTAYSWCEPTWGGNFRTTHIRRLTAAGLMLGGGIDTAPLCGRAFEGWDLEGTVTPLEATENSQLHYPNGTVDTCPECAAVLAEEWGD
jgi:hypothetical protein